MSQVDTGRRRRPRAVADSESAGPRQGPRGHPDRPRPPAGRGVGRRQRRAFAGQRRLAQRRAPQTHRGRRRPGRHDGRPDRRGQAGSGHGRCHRWSSRSRTATWSATATTATVASTPTPSRGARPTTPLPMEHNPRVVFERLFGEGGTTAQRLARLQEDRSILDAVRDDMTRLERRLGAGDRRRVSQYLDAVREIERRIQRVEAQADEGGSARRTWPARSGIPESFDRARPPDVRPPGAGVPGGYHPRVHLS